MIIIRKSINIVILILIFLISAFAYIIISKTPTKETTTQSTQITTTTTTSYENLLEAHKKAFDISYIHMSNLKTEKIAVSPAQFSTLSANQKTQFIEYMKSKLKNRLTVISGSETPDNCLIFTMDAEKIEKNTYRYYVKTSRVELGGHVGIFIELKYMDNKWQQVGTVASCK